MKTVRLIHITLAPDSFSPADIPRLRAYLSKQFPLYNELHNHTPEGGFRYVYPEIQFKFIDHNPVLIGYGKTGDIIIELFQKIGYIELNHRRIEIPEKWIRVTEQPFGECKEFIRYSFVTPWMALNQDNYRKYMNLNVYEKEIKLNSILWGNIRSLAHGLGHWIENDELMKVNGHFSAQTGQFKGNTMMTFSGHFITNFAIPEYLGLGKQVARGYGAVKRGDSN